jgi:hypothetical protein
MRGLGAEGEHGEVYMKDMVNSIFLEQRILPLPSLSP